MSERDSRGKGSTNNLFMTCPVLASVPFLPDRAYQREGFGAGSPRTTIPSFSRRLRSSKKEWCPLDTMNTPGASLRGSMRRSDSARYRASSPCADERVTRLDVALRIGQKEGALRLSGCCGGSVSPRCLIAAFGLLLKLLVLRCFNHQYHPRPRCPVPLPAKSLSA